MKRAKGEEEEEGGQPFSPLFPRPLSRTSFWLCGRPFLPPPFLTAVSLFGYGRGNGRGPENEGDPALLTLIVL